jgi:hypothetical protein
MRKMKYFIQFALVFCLIIFSGCSGGDSEMVIKKSGPFKTINDVPDDQWNLLNTKKIYFGHQSVGFNIVDGIKDVMAKNPKIKLNLVESFDFNDANGEGVFLHSRIGENMKPETKIDDFINKIETGIGNKADIAFFKLCYVDIDNSTDIDNVFINYKNKMEHLAAVFPNTRFLHLTIPLNTKPKEPEGIIRKAKEFVKTIIGRGRMDDGIAKLSFNEKIRSTYSNEGNLFDLALSEATDKNGKVNNVLKQNQKIEFLIDEYTYDGGHLNETGRVKIAEDLLLFLANAI